MRVSTDVGQTFGPVINLGTNGTISTTTTTANTTTTTTTTAEGGAETVEEEAVVRAEVAE